MTNDNYTIMSNQELVECIQKLNIQPKHLTHKFLKRNYPQILNELVVRTKFLDDSALNTYKITIRERMFCLLAGITQHPICQHPDCNNIVRWGKIKFKRYCCAYHATHDPEYHRRREEKCLKEHGVKNPMQLKCVQEKVAETTMKKYGVRHALQSPEIMARQNRTYMLRTEEQKQLSRQKTINTCRNTYGTDSPMQSKQVQMKSINTCKEIYGTDYSFQSEQVKSKIRSKLMEKYHVDNPSKSKQIQQKVKQRMMERYGVEWFPQSSEYHKKSMKPYTSPKYPGVSFANSWEFKVYDFLTENNILFEYQPNISIPYEYDGTHHTYHPDFKVGDRIVEVKGDQFFRINESTGKEEMYCPYRYPEWTDEYYEWKCGLYEAKHQCMLENGVVILRRLEIQSLHVQLFDV